MNGLPSVQHAHYPRGFIAGVKPCIVPSNYHELPDRDIHIYLEQGTLFVEGENGGAHVMVFGSVLDNESPDRPPSDIAENLARNLLMGRGRLLKALASLGGRHALLCKDAQGYFMVGDAGGARSIFYHTNHYGFIVSSHARLLADQIGAVISPFADNIQDLGNTYRARNWPGRQSMFQGVFQLTPNTSVNLKNGRVSRFFGKDRPPLRTAKEAAELVHKLLLNSVAAFCKHYLPDQNKALVFLTSGIDSRLVVSSFKYNYKKIDAVTYRLGDVHDSDMEIAKRVSETLGFKHYQLYGDNGCSENLQKWCEVNGANVYVGSRKVIEDVVGTFSGRGYRYSIRGNLGEISRGVFLARPAFVDQPARFMARNWFRGSDRHKAVIDCFQDFADAIEMESVQWPLRVLYYWEHKHATWFASTLNEMDIAFDTYVPMNSRNIIEAMCGVSEYDQESDMVHKELISILNRSLLDLPVNPGKYK